MQRQLGRDALALAHKLFATDPPPPPPAGAPKDADRPAWSATDVSAQGQLLLSR